MKPVLFLIAALVVLAALAIVAMSVDDGATAAARQFYRCHLTALKQYNNPDDEASPQVKRMRFVRYCMEAAGYEHDFRPNDVTCGSMTDAEGALLTSRCYVPMGRLSRGLQRLEKTILPPMEPPSRSAFMGPAQ